jgi:hypothetical protein
MLTRGVVAITLGLALLGCQQNGPGQRAIAVRTLASAPVTRAMPGVRLGPAGRPHVAHAGRSVREPREQRLSYLCVGSMRRTTGPRSPRPVKHS